MEKIQCPKCKSSEVKRVGFFRRKRNRQIIQRYLCKSCRKSFSDQTFSADYLQKRPDLNQKIMEIVSSGMGIRRLSKVLRTSKTTVQKKIIFMAGVCYRFHLKNMANWKEYSPRFQMDELETFEWAHGNTLKIPAIVEKDSHFIVSLRSLRDASRSQFPQIKKAWNSTFRKEILKKNETFKYLLKMCRRMKKKGQIVLETDGHKSYPQLIKDALGPSVTHIAYKTEDDKKDLFPLNNTMACMRSDHACLRRKTWHITKANKMLNARLMIYLFYNNYLNKKDYRYHLWDIPEWERQEILETYLKDSTKEKQDAWFRIESKTPAMMLGIFKKPVVEVY